MNREKGFNDRAYGSGCSKCRVLKRGRPRTFGLTENPMSFLDMFLHSFMGGAHASDIGRQDSTESALECIRHSNKYLINVHGQ